MWTRTQGMDSDTDMDMNLDANMNRNGPHVEAYKNSSIHRAMTNCALFIPCKVKNAYQNKLIIFCIGECICRFTFCTISFVRNSMQTETLQQITRGTVASFPSPSAWEQG